MKNIAIILVLALSSVFGYAQDSEILIKDLVKKGETTKFKITEAHYQPTDESSNQKGGAVGTYIYVVHRNQDNTSAKIEDAALKKKLFKDAQIWLKANGKTNKYKLNNAVINGYTAHFVKGKSASEVFILRFSDKEKLN